MLRSGMAMQRFGGGNAPLRGPLGCIVLSGLIVVLALLGGLSGSASADPTYGVMNAEGGIYWRSAPDWNTPEAVAGNGFYPNTIISVHCYQSGAANVPGSADSMWEQATDVGGSGTGSGWVNEHFINDGQPINEPSPGVPPCNAPPPQPPPPPSSPPPASSGGLVFPIFNAEGGIYYRNSPHWADTSATPGVGVYNGDQVELICGALGDPVGPYNDTAWSYVNNLSRPVGDGWVDEHFINDGAPDNAFVSGEPMCGPEISGTSGGGASGPTGGGSGSGGGDPAGGPAPPPTGHTSTDPCIARYPSGLQKTKHIFGGSETLYDRQSSLLHVCAGFGAPEGVSLSSSMQCALIAAAATYGGPVVNAGVSAGCNTGSIASSLGSSHWLGAASGIACGYFSTIFATGVGLFAAGASSETGPGAIAVGVNTYRALAAGLKLVCGGIFDGGLSALGKKLEANHETHIAVDVIRHGECMRLRHIFRLWDWGAVRC
jgi:hypothetical protein